MANSLCLWQQCVTTSRLLRCNSHMKVEKLTNRLRKEITRPEESYRVSNCMCEYRSPERGLMLQVWNDRKMNDE
jgi:hypothetical protein